MTASSSSSSSPSRRPRRLCVFCGSSSHVGERFRAAAIELGRLLGERGDELISGGGRVGLMGLVADAALEPGARVTGVIPRFLLAAAVGHGAVRELVITQALKHREAGMRQE